MPRADAKVTRGRVIDVAARMLDARGVDGTTLSAVARELGVRTPSLYHHVDGLEGLRQALRAHGIDQLDERLRSAAVGRAGRDALEAVARAHLSFARERPGLYELTLAGRGRDDDAAVQQSSQSVLDTVTAVLRGYDLRGDDAIHAARFVRSTLHGFATLERAGGFALDVDLEASVDRLLEAMEGGLERLRRRA